MEQDALNQLLAERKEMAKNKVLARKKKQLLTTAGMLAICLAILGAGIYMLCTANYAVGGAMVAVSVLMGAVAIISQVRASKYFKKTLAEIEKTNLG